MKRYVRKTLAAVDMDTKTKPPLAEVAQLAPRIISLDTVEALETLLKAARDGQVTGIACAAMVCGRRYITVTSGSCDDHPTFAVGMIEVLSDELRHMIHQRDPGDIR